MQVKELNLECCHIIVQYHSSNARVQCTYRAFNAVTKPLGAWNDAV